MKMLFFGFSLIEITISVCVCMFLLLVFVLLYQVGEKFSTKASLDQLRLLLPSKHRQFFDLEAAPSKRRRFFQGIPAEEPVSGGDVYF